MNLDKYFDQFFRIKDDFVRDARTHKVDATNLLDWMKEHLTPEEYEDASALGFATREEELQFFVKANQQFKRSDAVKSFIIKLRNVGKSLTPNERKEFIHALGDALNPDKITGPEADHARELKDAFQNY